MSLPLELFSLDLISHQTETADYDESISHSLKEIEKRFNIPAEVLYTDYEKHCSSQGNLHFYDYIKLNLWNPSFLGQSNKASYIGQQIQLKHAFKMYHDLSIDGAHITLNKVAFIGYLSQFGFPVIPLKAVYIPSLTKIAGQQELHSKSTLLSFLREPSHYPMFGKPVRYAQSLGTIGMQAVSENRIVTSNKKMISIASFAAQITQHFHEDGYMFQPLRINHSGLHPIIGSTLATVRVMTILTKEGFKAYRAAWKIPSSSNFADNYWRSGNLIAGIHIASGTITSVVSGEGASLQTWTHHPDTGRYLIGYKVPFWSDILRLALQGSRLFPRLPIMAWDFALLDEGAFIVEANDLPDFGIMQLACRQGMLEGELSNAFQQIINRYGETPESTQYNKMGELL